MVLIRVSKSPISVNRRSWLNLASEPSPCARAIRFLQKKHERADRLSGEPARTEIGHEPIDVTRADVRIPGDDDRQRRGFAVQGTRDHERRADPRVPAIERGDLVAGADPQPANGCLPTIARRANLGLPTIARGAKVGLRNETGDGDQAEQESEDKPAGA